MCCFTSVEETKAFREEYGHKGTRVFWKHFSWYRGPCLTSFVFPARWKAGEWKSAKWKIRPVDHPQKRDTAVINEGIHVFVTPPPQITPWAPVVPVQVRMEELIGAGQSSVGGASAVFQRAKILKKDFPKKPTNR